MTRPPCAFLPQTQDTFTDDETRALAPYFTNTDRPVFALTNLPETVKGALFARYSRSAKSLRRLFLDEFLGDVPAPTAIRRRAGQRVGTARADKLYARVLNEYGDDSVAQLGGAHLACEGVSNVLTKVLEWGRLMAYLEQSTRYVPYTDRPNGRWKYHVPAELDGSPLARRRSRARWTPRSRPTRAGFRRWKRTSARSIRSRRRTPTRVYRSVIRAKALDTLRGLLPAATTSNVGLFGTGQAFEALLLRMFAHPLEEVRAHAAADARRAAAGDPGVSRARRSAGSRRPLDRVPRRHAAGVRGGRARRSSLPSEAEPRAEVTLTDFDPDGEIKVVAAALYAASDAARRSAARRSRAGCRPTTAPRVLRAYVGERAQPPPQAGTRVRAHAATASTCSPTTAPSAISSAIACSRSSGSRSAPRTATSSRRRSRKPARSPTGATVMERSAALHDALVGARAARRRAVRRGDGLPRALLHGHERARGDARHRAAHGAAGPSRPTAASAS